MSSNTSSDVSTDRAGSLILVSLAFSIVLFGNLFLLLPIASSEIYLNNDTVGYVSVAVNWLEGQGFVDPILYSHYLPNATAPVPAIAIRAPIVSMLFAVPLKFGADLLTLNIIHAIWSSLIAAASLLVARRIMSLSAATVCAIAIGWSPAWLATGVRMLTETTTIGVLLVLIVVAPSALRSRSGAAGLALLTLIGWLTRPNLGVFVAIILLTAVISWGPRRALRSRELWTYALSFLVLHRTAVLLLTHTFGIAPYAHYGIMAETLNMDDVSRFQTEYAGAFSFTRDHFAAYVGVLARNIELTREYVFERPFFLYVGWLGIPGVLWAFRSNGPRDFDRKLVAVSAVGFASVAFATGWGFAVTRYLLPAVVCMWIASLALVSDVGRLIVRRIQQSGRVGSTSRIPVVVSRLPLAAMLLVFAFNLVPRARAIGDWFDSEPRAAVAMLQAGAGGDRISQSLCRLMNPDEIVASPDPWNILYWCGNAGYRLPSDLDSEDWLNRYLDEMGPGYLVANRPEDIALFSKSRRLTRIGRKPAGRVVLFRVDEQATSPRPWRSPGPLARLGRRSHLQ